MFKSVSANLQRVRCVGKAGGSLSHKLHQIACSTLQCLLRFRGYQHQMTGSRRLLRGECGSFLEHGMRVGAALSKGADSCTAWCVSPCPFRKPGVYVKRTILQIHGGIWALEMQQRRHFLIPQHQARIDQSRRSRSHIQVPHICLGGAQRTEVPVLHAAPEHLLESGHFN